MSNVTQVSATPSSTAPLAGGRKQHTSRRRAAQQAKRTSGTQPPHAAPARIPAGSLRDGDIVRWADRPALVRVSDGGAPQLQVRLLAHDSGAGGYSNRLFRWNDLQTPVYVLNATEELELLLTAAPARPA